MVVNRPNQKYEYWGATYTIGASVVATNANVYHGLCGTITEIRDGVDRETENEMSSIYCRFEPPVFPNEVQELDQRFSELYRTPKRLDGIALDMVIMAQEMVRGISPDPPVCKMCNVFLLTVRFSTELDSGYITGLYADCGAACFTMLKSIHEERLEGCIKEWAGIDDLEETYSIDHYEAWRCDQYYENHFIVSLEELPLILPPKLFG